MSDTIDLSIVIVSYNSSRVLPRCLRSIIEHALSHCPVHDALARPVPITVEMDVV